MKKFLPIVLVLLLATVAYAQQNRSRIIGTVTTAEGAVIVGVTVTIESDALIGRTMTTTTNERGMFRFVLLPLGTYDLKLEKSGYNTIEQKGIVVPFEETIALDKVMEPSEFEQVVTITGEAPVVDKTSSGIGDKLDLDFLQNVPSTRAVWGLAELTAGFTDDSGLGGNIEVGNAHTADGINLTDSASGGDSFSSISINIETVEQVDVALFGAPAEYGAFTGSTLNVVTKSGGNEFHGEVNYFAQRVGWVSDNTGEYETISAPTASKRDDPNFAVGGPIIMDKVWFFTNYGYFKTITQRELQNEVTIDDTMNQHHYFFKVSSRWDDRNITYGSYWGLVRNDTHRPGWGGYRTNLEDSMWKQPSDTQNFMLLHSHVLNEDLILEGRLSIGRNAFDLVPRNPGIIAVDWFTGMHLPDENGRGTLSRTDLYDRPRDNFLLSANYFNDDLHGTHSMKFGLEYDRSVSHRYFSMEDIFYFIGDRNHPVAQLSYNTYTSGIVMKRYSGFAQDSWNVSDRLTLNFGFRIDSSVHKSEDPSTAPVGDADILNFNNISPRIGFAYDLFGDGKNVIRGFYGRYYEGLVGSNLEDLVTNIGPSRYWGWGLYWYGVDYGWVLWDEWGGSGNKVVDPDADNMYTEGFMISYERELRPNMAGSVTYVYKRDRNQLGLIAPDVTWELININFSNENGSYSGPIHQNVTFGLREIYTNPNSSHPGMLDDLYRKYWGIMFEFNKRMSNRWSLKANYEYSKNAGNMYNGWWTGQGWDRYNDPNNFINVDENTRIGIDRPHKLKMSGTYVAPFDIYVSPVVTYFSGTPWAPWLTYGRDWVNVENMDGSRRYDGQFNIDLRLEKAFVFREQYRIGVIFDVFNLMNDDALTGYLSTDIAASTYMRPANVVSARFYQVGIRFLF